MKDVAVQSVVEISKELVNISLKNQKALTLFTVTNETEMAQSL